MPSTKTLNQSQTIGATEDADLLWIWDNSSAELDKISLGNLFAANQTFALLDGRSGGQTLIGGTAANDDLTLEGTSNATRTTSYVVIQPNGGNVGIGTTSPEQLLHVASTSTYNALARIEATGSGQAGLVMVAGSGANSRASRIDFLNVPASATVPQWTILNDRNQIGTNDLSIIDASYASVFTILQGGNVGIGTTSPSRKLHVAGTILIDGDEGGIAGTIGLTDVNDLAARSTGVGTIKFNDATNRDSSGFVKIYIGVTEYYIPVFAAI